MTSPPYDPEVVAHIGALPGTLEEIRLIQAGMGVGVSSWKLANKTARHKNVLGTVSGVLAHDIVLRALQLGDEGGHMRRALAQFPDHEFADQLVADYYVAGGIGSNDPFKSYPVFTLNPSRRLQKMMIAGTFVLVWLAREGHNGMISVNFLEKIQMTHLFGVYGAMLAGVDVITMGAGIIKQIPRLIADLYAGRVAIYKVDVDKGEPVTMYFDPEELFGQKYVIEKKPKMLAIVSSVTLARMLVVKVGGIDGLVIEAPIAGGHNAPARTKTFNDRGEPIYDETPPSPGHKHGPDWVDLEEFRKFKQEYGVPFFLAGGRASPEGLAYALSEGANGIQVGSAFALCDDSGLLAHLRNQARKLGFNGKLRVITSMKSPTGYPFKVADLEGTKIVPEIYDNRPRICNLCHLRNPVRQADGRIDYYCSAEPIEDFVRKGGTEAQALDKDCLCNGLAAAVGLGNRYKDRAPEPPIVTMGDDVSFLPKLMEHEYDTYNHADVINWILDRPESQLRAA